MNASDVDAMEAGLARHLAAADALIPPRPAWRAAMDQDVSLSLVRPGPLLRNTGRGRPSLVLVVTVGLLTILVVAYGLLGVGRSPTDTQSPTTTPSSAPTSVVGVLRPLIEPRLSIPVRPTSAWTLVEDRPDVLGLVYFFDEVGSGGFNVGLMVVEPHGVYDPADESRLLPLPADLMGWIQDHPDLETGDITELTVAGLPARAIDVTVTYRADGPKGQTAQFIDIGPGPWNLESPSMKRIVLVELPDRRLLVVFDSRPEFFEAGARPFEDELAQIGFAELGPSP